MGVTSFPVVSGAQVVAGGDATAKMELGTIIAMRTVTDQWSLVEYVQLDNNGVSNGEVLVTNFATLKQYSVAKAAVGDFGVPGVFRGIAAATIASQKFGFMYIGGYVEKADVSHTAASTEGLTISGSTAGKLTPDKASSYWGATVGLSSTTGTAPWIFAIAKTAIATGLGSVQICGIWG